MAYSTYRPDPAKKLIKITYIINPEFFWYKHDDLSENTRLNALETKLSEIALNSNCSKWKAELIKSRQIVVIFIREWHKWCRGLIENIDGSSAEIWCIDYACSVSLPINQNIIPLDDEIFADFPVRNVFIGGLSGIAPAAIVCISLPKLILFSKNLT